MALKATNSVPRQAYEDIRAAATQIDRLAQSKVTAWSATGGSAFEVIAVLDNAVAYKDRLVTAASTPGLAAYAQEQEDDPAYDVIAEYNALIVAIDGVIAEIVSTMPVSNPGGYAEVFTLAGDGSKTARSFTAAQLSGLISALSAVDAAIV